MRPVIRRNTPSGETFKLRRLRWRLPTRALIIRQFAISGPDPDSEFAIDQTDPRLPQAERCYSQGDLRGAEALFREILEQYPDHPRARESLVALLVEDRRMEEALEMLRGLIASAPEEAVYYDRLNTLCDALGKRQIAIDAYYALLERRPELGTSRYNLAHLLKRCGRVEEAVAEYRTCLAQGVDSPEEVHTNLSVIFTDQGRHEEAERSLRTALELNRDYPPATYNLALLLEERGDWKAARGLFGKLLHDDPNHVAAMVHLAQGETFTDPTNPLARKMTRALRRNGMAAPDREQIHYALGKVYDDCGRYDDAMTHFSRANEYSRGRAGDYEPDRQETMVEKLLAESAAVFAAIPPASDLRLVFLCGMFRSGTTLLEQVLAAHPALRAGGELDFFPREINRLAAPWPDSLRALPAAEWRALGERYLELLIERGLAPAATTNKRPDNFLYLGLIKALYPNARILHTVRDPLDTCLSIFCQPLRAELDYANDLKHIGHYYLQYRRLMNHWSERLGDDIVHVSYERLVKEPRGVIEPVLAFLGLDWDDACLSFHEVDNRVRTASLAQVRKPFYQSSSGRAENYARYLAPLKDYLETGP